ncbi:MAG: hypothetical protein IT386_01640 [Deltaproteobacteria bacterium]|nr:hypothetical protein [Deltaproteobacteria bacterium]
MQRFVRRFGIGVFAFALAAGVSAGDAYAQAQSPAGGAGSAAPAASKPVKARKARPAKVSITQACEIDSAIYCDDDEHRGVSKVACLRKNKGLVSADCASALGGR